MGLDYPGEVPDDEWSTAVTETRFGEATCDLAELQDLLRDSRRAHITRSAFNGAVSVGYASWGEIIARVLRLKKDEIYKTMRARNIPGLWQDVYRTEDAGFSLYIKLQKSRDGEGVIISFKRWAGRTEDGA